jgi:hypothetical protein
MMGMRGSSPAQQAGQAGAARKAEEIMARGNSTAA